MSENKTSESKQKSQTLSDQIWESIKDVTLDLFALPNQKVHMHVKRLEISPDALYLTLSSQAVLAALDTALHNKYSVEMADKYTIVKPLSK